MPALDDDEDDWEDDDYGEDDEEGEPTVPCPYCRREIHEDAERCPYCEQYISTVDAPPSRKPGWILVTVAVCLYMIYRWSFG